MIYELDIVLGHDKRHGLVDRRLLVPLERFMRKGVWGVRSALLKASTKETGDGPKA